MKQTLDDEVDLLELFEVLAREMRVIAGFVVMAFTIGVGLVLIQEPVYESKLHFSIYNKPPFYDEEKVLMDLEKAVYSSNQFHKWKKKNNDVTMTFDFISSTVKVEGVLTSKSLDDRKIRFADDKKTGSFISIKSSNLLVLNDFFNFVTYLNNFFRYEYISRSKSEINIISSRMDSLSVESSSTIDLVLAIDRYIDSAEKGNQVFIFQRPTLPKKVLPKTSQILLISIIAGGILGIFYVIILNAINKRNKLPEMPKSS